MSEFSFWPSSPPRDSGFPDGGIFEMRTYQLQPGKLFDWEAAWRRGLEARRRFVVSLTFQSRSWCELPALTVATGRGILLASWTIARSAPHLAVPVS